MHEYLSDDSFIRSHRQIFIAECNNPVHLLDYKPASYQDELYNEYGIVEPQQLSQWIPNRRAQFLAGRLAAKQAVALLNKSKEQDPVFVGDSRQPIWPDKVLGSISHSQTRSIASACHQPSAKSGLGIDIQQLIEADFQSQVAPILLTHTDEMQLASKSNELSSSIFFTLVFSAKESFFKAVFNTVEQYFNFTDVSMVKVNLDQQQLTLQTNKHLSETIPKGFEATISFDILQANTVSIITICQWEL